MKKNQKLYTKLAYKIYNLAKICTKCWSTKNVDIHHKDKNHNNNEENNLQILCHNCHLKLHLTWNKHALWYKHTKEAIRKIWEASKWNTNMLWRKLSKETKEKIRIFNTWKKLSEEHKRKMRWKWKLIDWLWLTEWKEKTWKSSRQFYKLIN